MEPEKYVEEKLKQNELQIAAEDPDNPKNFPRNLFIWRSNLLGSSAKGMEYFMKHLLGTQNSVFGKDLKSLGEDLPSEVKWHEVAPEGKLDLLVTIDYRMSTTGLHSDILLPAASWYEKNDLSTSDMHPFIHPFSRAVDPVWESRSDWDILGDWRKSFPVCLKVILASKRTSYCCRFSMTPQWNYRKPRG